MLGGLWLGLTGRRLNFVDRLLVFLLLSLTLLPPSLPETSELFYPHKVREVCSC